MPYGGHDKRLIEAAIPGVLLLNPFTDWTIVGWFGALIWA